MEQGYLDPLRVESLDAKNWMLLEQFRWKGSKGDTFTVEAGETTDFATVPWWTQSLIPRTGTWTKAAVLHDKMCKQVNEYRKLLDEREALVKQGVDPATLVIPIKPVFNSIDTDAVFRKNARAEGTGPIRGELLWFGVRCGALSRPRREGWYKTAPRFFADLAAILATGYFVVQIAQWIAS